MFYKINTNLTKLESEEILDSLSPDEVETLHSFNLKAHDEEVDGKMVSYIICDRSVFSKIVLFLRQKCVQFDFEDISDDVLTNNISFVGTDFEEEVSEFITENITVDHILDKINKFGINNLSEKDKQFLDNQ